MQNWHNLSTSDVLERLATTRQGLSSAEAKLRTAKYGFNELQSSKKVSPWLLFLEQFKSFLIIILLVAIALSIFLGEYIDAGIIGAIVIFSCGLGFIQEYRAERAMEALKRMAAPTASVIRDGEEKEIPARELVPGDIVVLRTGDMIPADCRLLEAVNLKVNEAPLTGESVPVDKDADVITDASSSEKTNMVFSGTSVVYGRGLGIVTATGMSTEFGKIAGMIQDVRAERTPLQINLDKLGKRLAIAALALCFILVVLGILRGHDVFEMIIWGIALAVAAVPEALPAIVVISLALGVRRMVKRNALIRKLPAVETLGCTTVICSDKTGTMTKDQMTVKRIYFNDRFYDVEGTGYEPYGNFYVDNNVCDVKGDAELMRLLKIATLCNDCGLIQGDGVCTIKGDPTEGALLVAAAKAGINIEEVRLQYPRVAEVPFTSETKMMSTVHRSPEGSFSCAKGAPEVILDRCRYMRQNGSIIALDEKIRARINQVAYEMAGAGLRVLAIASKEMKNDNDSPENELIFEALMGMIDPPRPEAKAAIRKCEDAGIKTVMVTGDHKLTAMAIAKELGVYKGGRIVTGAELSKLSDKELDSTVEEVDVCARVSPEDKLRIVSSFTRKKHVVAVTGDGVNDAPALKKADIGIAMGVTGTDVSKEAADMILTDDNFASIVAAVEEGRGIFDNIKKYLMYLLSSNLGEILLMAGAILLGPLLGLPSGAIPLIAVQILWVNLATDGLPAIALSLDPPTFDIMQQKPRPREQGIFTKPVVILMVTGGVWSFIVNIGIFKWALSTGYSLEHAQGICFISLILIQFFKAYNYRSDRHSIFKIGFFANKWLNIAIMWELALLMLILFIPGLQKAFHTFPPDPLEWIVIIGASLTVFPVLELTKFILNRKSSTKQ